MPYGTTEKERIKEANEMIQTLREALAFYANPESWDKVWGSKFDKWSLVDSDKGATAQEAIKKLNQHRGWVE